MACKREKLLFSRSRSVLLALAGNTAGASATEGRLSGDVDVLLGFDANHERGHVDDVLTNAHVAVANANASVVDGENVGHLGDNGLKTTVEESLNLQGQNVLKSLLALREDTETSQTAQEGGTLEGTARVLAIVSCREHEFQQTFSSRLSRSRAAARILARVY